MSDTTARLLRLLGLLQGRPSWPGAELAERLEVTGRTVRRDVDRLRELGYPIEADQGVAGYRLGSGGRLPPLLLDGDEAVAMAVGLRTSAAVGNVTGIEESTLGALAKLEALLPPPARARIRALSEAVQPIAPSGPTVAADLLATLAAACRDHQRLHVDYRRGDDHRTSPRVVEPLTIVHTGKRWYLVAWDVDAAKSDAGEAGAWRTLRIDRLALRGVPGPTFEPREPPAADVTEFVSRGIATVLWPYRAEVVVPAPLEVVTEREIPAGWVVSRIDDGATRIEAGAESARRLALYLLLLDLPLQLERDSEVATAVAALGAAALAATAAR